MDGLSPLWSAAPPFFFPSSGDLGPFGWLDKVAKADTGMKGKGL
jgi:hypothetical protein